MTHVTSAGPCFPPPSSWDLPWRRPVATQQAAPVQRDFSRELANKMRGPYVVAATGGVLMQELSGRQASPALQRVLRDAQTTIGSVEFYQVDRPGGVGLAPARELARDLGELGFDLLGLGDSRAVTPRSGPRRTPSPSSACPSRSWTGSQCSSRSRPAARR